MLSILNLITDAWRVSSQVDLRYVYDLSYILVQFGWIITLRDAAAHFWGSIKKAMHKMFSNCFTFTLDAIPKYLSRQIVRISVSGFSLIAVLTLGTFFYFLRYNKITLKMWSSTTCTLKHILKYEFSEQNSLLCNFCLQKDLSLSKLCATST